tara:strand:- start:3927 stop:5921 length:1995 start_codon:yes stop_codon:yes gene_type:complete
MAWGAVLKGVAKGVGKGARKVATDKLLNRKKNVKNRRAKAQEAMGGGEERGGALAIRPTTPLAPTIGGGALATIGGSGGGSGGGGGAAADNTPEGTALNISTNIIKVENLLKNSYTMKQKVREDARKQSKVDEDKEQEKALEKVKKPKSKIKIPGAKAAEGLLGKVFNFIGAMLLGWIAVRWQEWLPKLIAILKPIAAIADWIINVAGVILDALAGVIDFGYKLVDKMEGWVKDIYGEEGAEKFKTFMTNLKDLIAGFLVWKIIGEKLFKAFVGVIKNAWKAVTGAIRKAWVSLKRMVGRKARMFFKNLVKRLGDGAKTVGGKILNVGKNIGGKVLGGAKNVLGKVGGIFRQGGGKLASTGAGKVAGKVGGFAAKIFGKAAGVIGPAIKGAMPAIKGFAKRIPIFGSLIVALVSLMSGEPVGQALFKAVGAGLGGALGTFIPIPFLGTLLGETFGMFIGDALYYGIVKGDWKQAGVILKQHLMGIFKAGKAVGQWIGGGLGRFVDNLMKKDPIGIKEGLGRRAAATKIAEILGMKKWLNGLGYVEDGQVTKFPNILNLLNPLKFYPLLFKSFFPPSEEGGGVSIPAGGGKEKVAITSTNKNQGVVDSISTRASYEDSSAGTIRISPPTTTSSETSSGDSEGGAVKFIPISSGGGDPYEELDFFG